MKIETFAFKMHFLKIKQTKFFFWVDFKLYNVLGTVFIFIVQKYICYNNGKNILNCKLNLKS